MGQRASESMIGWSAARMFFFEGFEFFEILQLRIIMSAGLGDVIEDGVVGRQRATQPDK